MTNSVIPRPAGPPAKIEPGSLEAVLVQGDLSKLTPDQRVQYYHLRCTNAGLDPYSRPFDYIVLSNKLILYANKNATDQLRKVHSISVEIVNQQEIQGVYTVHVRARTPDGRTDEDVGTVSIANLKGEMRGNAILKAISKAKRRVTLSVVGMGMLDETEVETIPSRRSPPAQVQSEIIAALAEPTKALPGGIEDVRRLLQQAGLDYSVWSKPLNLPKIEELSEGEAAHVAEMLRVRIDTKKDKGGVK